MHVYWFVEPLERYMSKGTKRKLLPDAKFGHNVGHQNLFGLGMSTKARRELDGCTENIIVSLDRLAGGRANARLEAMVFPR